MRSYSAGRFPRLPMELRIEYQPSTRAESDALAAWHRWHEPTVFVNVSDSQAHWYKAFERARVQMLAARHLPGIAKNVRVSLEDALVANPGEVLLILIQLVFYGSAPSAEYLDKLPPWKRLKKSFAPGLIARIGFGAAGKSRFTNREILGLFDSASKEIDYPIQYFRILLPLIELLSSVVSVKGEADEVFQPQSLGNYSYPDLITEEHNLIESAEAESRNTGLVPSIERRFAGYFAFSELWDEERPASHWLQASDKSSLAAIAGPGRREMLQLARQLQRRLGAASLREWEFDLDEGRIDNRRLARLVGDRPNSFIFRREASPRLTDAFVTFLIDQSGSMRGERQKLAAMTIDLAVHTMELCHIPCEVLGFTTTVFDHKEILHRWRKSGVKNPGRLNAVRHIRYKSSDQPWNRFRGGLGLMLREGFGCENIDGEALDWAARRLSYRKEKSKILVVLSDGRPFDKQTVDVNGRKYLEDHLRDVIKEIERSGIKILAIGAQSDLFRFYSNARIVREASDIAFELFTGLSELLLPANRLQGKR